MRRFFLIFALSLWVCNNTSALQAADNGTKLFDIFNKALMPRESIMVLSSQPRDDGRIPMMYLDVKEAVIAGMTVQDAQVTAYELMTTAPAQWSSMAYPRILSMLDCSVTARVTQKHIDDYMTGRSFSGGQWHSVKVKLQNGYFEASGKYLADLKFFKTNVALSLKGRLEIRQGSQLWLEVLQFQVNSSNMPLWIVRKALQKIQPILDLEKFVIPARLNHIDISSDSVVFSTRRHPQPFDGLSWYFKRDEALP